MLSMLAGESGLQACPLAYSNGRRVKKLVKGAGIVFSTRVSQRLVKVNPRLDEAQDLNH
jgi:hypothetical protein